MKVLKDQVLALLERMEASCSGSEIAASLGVSRAAVWKAVEALRSDGYIIESATKRGYRLSREQDILSRSRITSLLRTRLLGRELEVLSRVDSTNTYLKEAARRGAPDGLAVIADQQTGGRGRMGRTFVSPAGTGIYMSLLLRPNLPASDCTILTVAAAVCTARAIAEITGVEAQIKWVNDLLVDGRKLCGILTEASMEFETGMADYVVVGIGVNVGNLDGLLEDGLRSIVTSLGELTDQDCLRNRLAAAILNHLDDFYADLSGQRAAMLEEYRRRLYLTGRRVRIAGDAHSPLYTVVTVDDDAHLVVEDPAGVRRALSSGEVSVLPVDPQ